TKGLVRAFDVRSGRKIWQFNTIPRPGEPGGETWQNESWTSNGNVGVWTQITVDEDLGLVYLPVETPSSDYYGGHRPGDNLFAESLVCVDLKTGQRKWHFQPELRAEAVEKLKRYKVGASPFTPAILGDVNGSIGAIGAGTATNWPGGGYDPETHVVYAPAGNLGFSVRSLVAPPAGFSDI